MNWLRPLALGWTLAAAVRIGFCPEDQPIPHDRIASFLIGIVVLLWICAYELGRRSK